MSAPVPTFAQIPIPPGFDAGVYLSAITTAGITVAVGFALVGYDYFVLLKDEISMYRGLDKRSRTSPAFIAFIVLRYAGILALLPGLWFTSVQTQHCQFAASISQAGVVIVTASAGIIFWYRVYAIWGGDRIVSAVVGFFYCAMVGSWIATATQLKALTGPPALFGSNCIMMPVPSWSPIGFASSVIFDCVILVLGLAKLQGNMSVSSQVSRRIYQDNIVYFILVTCTNIIVLAIQALPASYDLVKPNALPYSTVITYAMGSRVFLNLRLFYQRQQRQAEGLPLSTNPSSSYSSGRTHQASGSVNFKPSSMSTYTADSKPTWSDDIAHSPQARLEPIRYIHAEAL